MLKSIECKCGNEVELEMFWVNKCQNCGSEYNGFGQRLSSREQWGEETNERLS